MFCIFCIFLSWTDEYLYACSVRTLQSKSQQIFKLHKVDANAGCTFLEWQGRFAQGHHNQPRPSLLVHTNSEWVLGGYSSQPNASHLPWVLSWKSFEKGFDCWKGSTFQISFRYICWAVRLNSPYWGGTRHGQKTARAKTSTCSKQTKQPKKSGQKSAQGWIGQSDNCIWLRPRSELYPYLVLAKCAKMYRFLANY